MKIVGFGHKSRQGKDTAAGFLINYLKVNRQDLKVRRVGFADKVKDICSDLFGLQDRQFYENNPTARKDIVSGVGKSAEQIWIEFATACRAICSDCLINYLFGETIPKSQADIIIVTDIRFIEEIRKIQEAGGICIKVVKDESLGLNSQIDKALDGFDDSVWDHVVANNGTLGELHNKVIRIWENYNG